jgi:hypothetical protein
MNIAWSILAKGRHLNGEFTRRVDSSFYRADDEHSRVIDILVPYRDNLFTAYRIEQLIQLLLVSDLKDRLLEFDPVNLYQTATLSFPPASATNTTSPVDVLYFNEVAEETEGLQDVVVDIDPILFEATINSIVIPFSYTNSLSSLIEVLQGREIRLHGVLPALPFSFVIHYVGTVHVDWRALLDRIALRRFVFEDPDLRKMFEEDVNWINRIAALTMSTLEGSRDN